MSILWITLAVLAGAFIVGGTAIYFLRARFVENIEAATSNLQSVAAPVPVAEEVRAIGDQIERAMTESRLQGETQRQLLAQKLDSVRHSVETQRHHVDGIRNELRHEIRRRDVEISEIKTQISTISTTIGLPAAPEAQAALPPAPAAPGPSDAFQIPTLADPGLAPPPPAEAPSMPVVEAPDPAPAEEHPAAPAEPSSFAPVSFASIRPDVSAEAPLSFESAEVSEFYEPDKPLDVDAPVAMPVQDFDVTPPFVIDPVGDAERDAAQAAFPAQPDLPAEPLPAAPAPMSQTDPLEDLAPATPVDEPAPFEEYSGDSFAEMSFQDVSFGALEPTEPELDASAPEPADDEHTFETWAPAPPDAAPVMSAVDLSSLLPDSDRAGETMEAETAQTEADPVETAEALAPDLGPWVARPAREEAELPTFPFGDPVHASAADFLPSMSAAPAPEPAAAPEPEEDLEPAEISEAIVPTEPSPALAPSLDAAAPAPDHADDLTVISSIDADVQRLLYAEGIHTLDQIAQMGRSTARRVSIPVQVSEETIMNQWVFEAQAALFTQFSSRAGT